MPTYDCDDFRVTFTRVGSEQGIAAEYQVDATYGEGRTVGSRFRLPMSATRLEELVVNLGRSGIREIAPDDQQLVEADAETLGSELGNALFDDVIGPTYLEAQRLSAANDRGVRLTLSLGSTPELLSIPWELLYRRPRFLASQRHTPVVRYLEVGDVPAPLPIDGPVRVLGVVASPAGLAPLDVEGERARVEQALGPMIDRGLVELEWCDPARRRSLRQCLADGTFHILHFVGHSDFDANGDGFLYLIDRTGGPDPVNDSVLTALLGDQTSLRLVVLNSCKGARTTLTDPFSGIATSLVALGLPAVVAMQFSISDDAAIAFSEELFTSLIGRQYPIDAAVSEARKAVFTEVNEIEWATPVLFLRAVDAQLFEFAAEPAPIPLKVAPMPVIAVDTDEPAQHLDPPETPPPLRPPPPEGKSPRDRFGGSRSIAIAIALLVIAIGVVGWFARDRDAPSDAVTEPGTVESESPVPTEVVTKPVAPIVTLAPDPSPSATPVDPTCNGDPLPPPPLRSVEPEVSPAFAAAQHWADLVASIQPGADNSAIVSEIVESFPNGSIQSVRGADGFAGMEASYLLPVDASRSRDGTTTLDVAALVYDNATSATPCRTGLLCSRYVVSGDETIASWAFTAAPALESRYPYVDDRWIDPSAPSPFDESETVTDWFTGACADVAPR